MSTELPKQTDSLFLEETDPKKGAWIENPTNKFFYIQKDIEKLGINYTTTMLKIIFLPTLWYIL